MWTVADALAPISKVVKNLRKVADKNQARAEGAMEEVAHFQDVAEISVSQQAKAEELIIRLEEFFILGDAK